MHSTPGRNQLFISGGGSFHQLSYNDVIVLIQPWYNSFANGHIHSFRNISENESLLVLIRPVSRGAKPTLKFFSPPWKNVMDIV